MPPRRRLHVDTFRLQISLLNYQNMLQAVFDTERRIQNLKPVFDKPIAASMYTFWRKHFRSQGREGGTPWAPLAPYTIWWKSRHNRLQYGTLRFSRRLWTSLVKRNAPDGIKVATAQSLLIGTSDRKAILHQQGTVNMPARPIVPPQGMPPELVDHWGQIIAQYVGVGDIRGTALRGTR